MSSRSITVGRAPANDLVLSGDDSVGTAHAIVTDAGSHLLVRDLGTAGGTLIAGKGDRITSIEVAPEETVIFGRTAVTARELAAKLRNEPLMPSPARLELESEIHVETPSVEPSTGSGGAQDAIRAARLAADDLKARLQKMESQPPPVVARPAPEPSWLAERVKEGKSESEILQLASEKGWDESESRVALALLRQQRRLERRREGVSSLGSGFMTALGGAIALVVILFAYDQFHIEAFPGSSSGGSAFAKVPVILGVGTLLRGAGRFLKGLGVILWTL
jgi:hypothetical protein